MMRLVHLVFCLTPCLASPAAEGTCLLQLRRDPAAPPIASPAPAADAPAAEETEPSPSAAVLAAAAAAKQAVDHAGAGVTSEAAAYEQAAEQAAGLVTELETVEGAARQRHEVAQAALGEARAEEHLEELAVSRLKHQQNETVAKVRALEAEKDRLDPEIDRARGILTEEQNKTETLKRVLHDARVNKVAVKVAYEAVHHQEREKAEGVTAARGKEVEEAAKVAMAEQEAREAKGHLISKRQEIEDAEAAAEDADTAKREAGEILEAAVAARKTVEDHDD
mmetsp:Transcript_12410/g.28401  ORF Transcript_12410/g.28401 Transcript_12410/m.28401 type:complete len:280 (-) Transcript_12410:40-879(-)